MIGQEGEQKRVDDAIYIKQRITLIVNNNMWS